MKKSHILLIIGYVILFLLLGYAIARWDHWYGESNRHEQNYKSQVESNRKLQNGIAITQELTRKQFEERFKFAIDSLKRITSEKIRRINQYAELRIKQAQSQEVYWRDSLIYVEGQPKIVGRTIKFGDSCFKGSVYYPLDSAYALVNYDTDIQAKVIFFEGRRVKELRLFGKRIIGLPWGERENKVQVFTNCDSAKIEVQNIQVIR